MISGFWNAFSSALDVLLTHQVLESRLKSDNLSDLPLGPELNV